MRKVIIAIKKLLSVKSEWEYGKLNDRIARRHRKNKNVQFVLWNKGEQGNKEDYWINFDKSWWVDFKSDEN